jgi:ABC-type antimicrobial peptide transport system permease subunit
VLINESLAQSLWPDQEPLGKLCAAGPLRSFVVVGVVGNYQWAPLAPKDRPALFEPFTGVVASTIVARVRPDADIKELSKAIDGAASSLIAGAPRTLVDALDVFVGASRKGLRTTLLLLGGFAFLGVIVAGFGVYTSVTLLVASMRRDLGIRAALGATRGGLRLMLAGRVVNLLAVIPLGWALGLGVAKLLSHLLFGVATTDFASYAASTAAVVVAVAAAAAVPVFRAGGAAPAAILRSD